MKNIGALWKQTSSKGGTFYKGTITIAGEEIVIYLFKNKFKNKKSHPDLTIAIEDNEQDLFKKQTNQTRQSNQYKQNLNLHNKIALLKQLFNGTEINSNGQEGNNEEPIPF